MTYEKDPLKIEEIPDFALQPAKDADEYSFHYMPRGINSRFDPAAYERVLHETARQAAEKEGAELLDIQEEQSTESSEAAAETPPESCAEMNAPEPEEAVDFQVSEQESEEAVQVSEPELVEEAEPMAVAVPEKEAVAVEETETVAVEEIEAVAEPEAEIVAEPETEPAAVAEPESEAYMEFETVADASKEKAVEEKAKEFIPPFKTAAAKRPVLQPAFVPKTAPAKIVPVVGNLMSSKLKMRDMKQKDPIRMTLEEDILVPDVKPDLADILAMDGKIKLSDKEIHTGAETSAVRISGDLILQTIYIPEHMTDKEPIVSIESKIPFKNDAEMKAGPNSDLTMSPTIESMDFTVINERKFRVRATVIFGVKEYSNVDIEVFEGLRDEEVQMLKEKIQLTDVALRKTDTIEVKDDMTLKENMPEVLNVLKYDVNIVENHKQVTKEKAVINASVNCNILYLGADGNTDAVKSMETGPDEEIESTVPVLYQGKTEFTQFIRLDGDYNSGEENPAGSKVNFNISSLNLTAKEDGNGRKGLFELDMSVDTGLELYKNIEKEIVTDVYHHQKDVKFDTDEIGVMALGGSGVAEVSAREIVNVPEKYGNVDKVAYVSGNIIEKRSFIDQSKSVVEGVVNVNVICTSADEKNSVFSLTQEIPFRSAMEIPGITSDMVANNDIALKELWFDKINNKQIEVNAGILVNAAVSSQIKHQLVKNVSFLESPQDSNPVPGIILYVARTGDTIWNIAKKYRTTIDDIKKINDLELGKEISPGTKLLIVAKNH